MYIPAWSVVIGIIIALFVVGVYASARPTKDWYDDTPFYGLLLALAAVLLGLGVFLGWWLSW